MRLRRLAIPAYLTVVALLVFPLIDLIVATWPLRAGSVAWRFSTVSVLGRTLISPLLGLFLAAAVATLLEHPRMLRVFSVLNGLVTVGFLGLAGLYVLDVLQLRDQVGMEQEARFRMGAAATLGKLGLGALLTLSLAWMGWRISTSVARKLRREQADDEGGRIVTGVKARPSPTIPQASPEGQ